MLSVPPGLRRQHSADAAPQEPPLERRLWAWVVTLQAFASYLAGAAHRAAAEAARAKATSARLKKDLSACQRDRDDLRSAAAGLTADVAAARADLAAECDAHASSAAAAAEREAQLRAEVAHAHATFAAGQERERRLQGKLDEQITHAREAEAKAAKAAVSQAQLREKLQTSERVKSELRSAVAQLSGDVTAVKTQLAAAQDARSNDAAAAAERETQLRDQLSASQQTNNELRSAVATVTADAAAMQTELVAAQDAHISEAAAAVDRETQLHDQLSACQRDNAERRSAVAKVTADVTVVQTALAAAQDGRTADAAAAAERETQLQTVMAAQKASIAAGVTREAQLRKDVQAQKTTAAVVTKQLRKREKKVQVLVADLKACSAAGRERESRLREQAELQAASIAAAVEREETLRAEAAALDATIAAAQELESRLRQDAKVQAARLAASIEREQKLKAQAQEIVAYIKAGREAPHVAKAEVQPPVAAAAKQRGNQQKARAAGGRRTVVIAYCWPRTLCSVISACQCICCLGGPDTLVTHARNDSFCCSRVFGSVRSTAASCLGDPGQRYQPRPGAAGSPACRPHPARCRQTRRSLQQRRVVERRLIGGLAPLRLCADLGRQQPLQHRQRAAGARPRGRSCRPVAVTGCSSAAGRQAIQRHRLHRG